MRKPAYLNFTAFRNSPEPYLHKVQAGSPFILTRYGRPVAELRAPESSGSAAPRREAILSGAGLLADTPPEKVKKFSTATRRRANFFRVKRSISWE